MLPRYNFFNELYQLSLAINVGYDTVINLMLKNGWINAQHTRVPGQDGKLSYGGICFPKDTNALLQDMKRRGVIHGVLEAVITERNTMRDGDSNN